MSLNDQGIPSLKDLYCGVTMWMGAAKNRHLALAMKLHGLEDASFYITLMEEEIDEEEWEEEEDEETPDLQFQVAGNFITLGDSEDEEDEDDEDEEIEYCEDYPDGCEACEECVCFGEEDEPEGHNVMPILKLVLIEDGVTTELDENHPLLDEPAFIRFLNQVTETHDL